MNLRPLNDCIQIPLDDDYNEILIYYYTDSPNRSYDGFVRKRYKIPDEIPLYLCKELWKWEDGKYVKKERSEELLKKKEAQILIKKYLRFMIPTHEWDMNYRSFYEKHKNYKHSLLHQSSTDYYNLGDGGRWNRAWDGSPYEDEDSITMRFGPIY